MGPCWVQPEQEIWVCPPVDPPPAGGVPQQIRLVIGTQNVTTLVGKEPEVMHEVEKCLLDIVRLTSTHSSGYRTNPLKRGLTFFFAGVAPDQRRRAGASLLVASWLAAGVFLPMNESPRMTA